MATTLELQPQTVSTSRGGSTGFSWSQEVRNRRGRVTDSALRIWLIAVAALVCVRGIVLMSHETSPSFLAEPVETAISIGTISLALALALRTPRLHHSEKSIAIQAGLINVSAAATFTLGTLHVAYGQDAMHTAIIVLMTGFAMLLPLPPKLGVPVLIVTAVVYPVAQLSVGFAHVSDVFFASQTVDLCIGFGVALLIHLLHHRLFVSRSQALRDLARLAENDGLTGVYNRRTFLTRMAAEANRSERYGATLGLVIYDIDNFKRFNTEFGYATGDRMLIAVADALTRVTVAAEFARYDGCVARYGGEEFVALLPDADYETLKRFMHASQAAVADVCVMHEGEALGVTLSAGSIFAPGNTPLSPTGLFNAADTALYEAKNAGGNQAVTAPSWANADVRGAHEPVHATGVSRPAVVPETSARDDENLQWLVLRGMLLITATWVFLLSLMDIAFSIVDVQTLPLWQSLMSRAVCSGLFIVLAWKSAWLRTLKDGVTITQTAYTAILIAGTFWMMEYSGGVTSPYFSHVVMALCGWTVAFNSRPRWSAGILAILVIGFPSYFSLVHGLSIADPPLIARTAVLVCAAVVTLSTQNVFAHLRRAELTARHQLFRLARVDPLTGMPNRTAFEERLTRLVRRAKRGQPLSLIVLDLDHFKRLNDTLGHLAGDDALTLCASVIESTIRTADVSCRLGGEEFAVALPMTHLDGAVLSAQRLRRRIPEVQVGGPEFPPLTASFGVVEWQPGDTVNSLIARADTALRHAKLQGRNCVNAE